MRTIKIRKAAGKFREIYIPSRKEKDAIYAVLPGIARKAKQSAGEHVHGFIRGRSCVTAATQHIGHAWTLSMDLEDFFAQCKESQLKGKLTKEELSVVLVDGAPRQGLPSSPSVANLAAIELDKALLAACDKRQAVYTRYADDLTFSGDDPEVLAWFLKNVPAIVARCGFKVAKSKTHVYYAKDGKRIILGIAVGDSGLSPTRDTKRRLRAAMHQKNKAHAEGLREYMRLKPPSSSNATIGSNVDIQSQCLQLAKRYKLGNIAADRIPDKGPSVSLSTHAEITGDPVAMLGMSLFTTGWTSCHSLKSGARKRGCVFWAHLSGTRLAAVYHETKRECTAGVERRLMRARCLVHTMRDGSQWYDRCYGESAAIEELKGLLESKGIFHVLKATKGLEVVGHAPAKWKAWFDSLKSRQVKAKSGRYGGLVRVCFI
jgi:RNA-directed DNA polymerase